MRINKYLSTSGLCSRREADRLIKAGRVSIDGRTADAGAQVGDGMEVRVDGRVIAPPAEKVYIKLYKPVGIVCTADSREKNNVIDYLGSPVRVTYAGRLDRNSEGLLLMTNDGDLIQALMRARSAHEKEYEVRLSRRLTKDELDRLREGVYLDELDTVTRPCVVEETGDKEYRFVLTQGLNRQIRRMCGTVGASVKKLKRIRVATVKLGDMREGDRLPLTEEEKRELFAAVFPEKEIQEN